MMRLVTIQHGLVFNLFWIIMEIPLGFHFLLYSTPSNCILSYHSIQCDPVKKSDLAMPLIKVLHLIKGENRDFRLVSRNATCIKSCPLFCLSCMSPGKRATVPFPYRPDSLPPQGFCTCYFLCLFP